MKQDGWEDKKTLELSGTSSEHHSNWTLVIMWAFTQEQQLSDLPWPFSALWGTQQWPESRAWVRPGQCPELETCTSGVGEKEAQAARQQHRGYKEAYRQLLLSLVTVAPDQERKPGTKTVRTRASYMPSLAMARPTQGNPRASSSRNQWHHRKPVSSFPTQKL